MHQLRECFFAKVRRPVRSIVCRPFNVSLIGRAEERVAKLVDSPDKPESEASYKLDEGGWADV
jgi:hypothetical protein